MNERPQIFAFYSFKGGVGRTMALLNLAYALVSKGRNVLVLDMDLEAPGLSGFMHREKEFSGFPRSDMLDLLLWARQTAEQLPEDALLDPSGLPLLSDYTVSVLPEKLQELPHMYCELGRLDVIPIDETRNFYRRLAQVAVAGMDREALVRVGSLLRSWLKSRRITLDVPDYYGPVPEDERLVPYDYVLVDSRTGITEAGGLCIGPLSDQLVVLCGLNDQNVEGTRHFLTEVGVLPPQPDATSPLGKPTLFVASPVPVGEMQTKTRRLTRLKEMLGPVGVEIPYHPQMALMETIFVRDYPDEELTARYRKLLELLLKRAGDGDNDDFDRLLLTRVLSQKGLTEQTHKSLNRLLRVASVSALGKVLFSVMNQFDLEALTTDDDFRLLDRICRANLNDDSFLQFAALDRWSDVLFGWSRFSKDETLAGRRFEAGIERLTRIIESPNASNEIRAWGLFDRGFRFGQQHEIERELADYTAVIKMTDAPAELKANALVYRGITFGQQNETDRQLADYTAVIEMADAPSEQKANALVYRGITFGRQNETEREVADYTTVVEMADAPSEQKANALIYRGIAFGQQNETERELADYTAVIEMADAPSEQKANALFNRAITFGKRNETERELYDYTAVIEMTDPPAEQKADALVNRGNTFGQLNDTKQALADFTAVIEMADAPPEQKANALVNRGWFYFETARIMEAIADLRQAVALNPADWIPCGNLAIALLVNRQTAEALAAYDAALRLTDAAGLATLDRELREAIEKHGPLPGADEVHTRIDSRAANLPKADTQSEPIANAPSVDLSI